MWQCRKHGANCKSYVRGLIETLERDKTTVKTISKEDHKLVKWIREKGKG